MSRPDFTRNDLNEFFMTLIILVSGSKKQQHDTERKYIMPDGKKS
jgi:hypothetical protein